MKLDGAIQPASLRYVERGLRTAAAERAKLMIIELDTPGGTLVSLRSMTTAITQSKVPVAVYVTPAGAHAASAGFFLLLAADVAAVTPGTNTGAAHPVSIGQAATDNEDDTNVAKAVEDAAALGRSLAQTRERNADWAERAVRDSLAYSADEALEHGLVEIVAADRGELLRKLDGTRLRRFDGSSQQLTLGRAQIVMLEPTLPERVLMVIANPELAYMLLMLGMLGLMIELMNPGLVVPGLVGTISLLSSLYAFSVLPVNWVGFLLIVIGLGLLVAEAFVTSYGVLAIAGIASFAFGSMFLVDAPAPAAGIGLDMVVPAVLVLGATSFFLANRAWRASRARVQVGLEAMIGEIGELTDGIGEREGEGRIFVHGEYWTATAQSPLPSGMKVRVEHIEGRRLRVAPLHQPSA